MILQTKVVNVEGSIGIKTDIKDKKLENFILQSYKRHNIKNITIRSIKNIKSITHFRCKKKI